MSIQSIEGNKNFTLVPTGMFTVRKKPELVKMVTRLIDPRIENFSSYVTRLIVADFDKREKDGTLIVSESKPLKINSKEKPGNEGKQKRHKRKAGAGKAATAKAN